MEHHFVVYGGKWANNFIAIFELLDIVIDVLICLLFYVTVLLQSCMMKIRNVMIAICNLMYCLYLHSHRIQPVLICDTTKYLHHSASIPTFSVNFFIDDIIDAFETSTQKMIKRQKRVQVLLMILKPCQAELGITQKQIDDWNERYECRIKEESFINDREIAVNTAAIPRNRSLEMGTPPISGQKMCVSDPSTIDPLKINLEAEITSKVSTHNETRSYAFQVILVLLKKINDDAVLSKYTDAIRFGVKGSTAIVLLFVEKIRNSTAISEEDKVVYINYLKTEFDGGDVDTSIYIDVDKLPQGIVCKYYHAMIINRLTLLIESVFLALVKTKVSKQYVNGINHALCRASTNNIRGTNLNDIRGTNLNDIRDIDTNNTYYIRRLAKSIRITPCFDGKVLFEHSSNRHHIAASNNSLDFYNNGGLRCNFKLLRLKAPFTAYWGCHTEYYGPVKAEVLDISIPTYNDRYITHIQLIKDIDYFTFNFDTSLNVLNSIQ